MGVARPWLYISGNRSRASLSEITTGGGGFGAVVGALIAVVGGDAPSVVTGAVVAMDT